MANPALVEEIPRHLHNAPLTSMPGQHLWAVIAIHRVNPVMPQPWVMSADNLLTAEGPGCFFCNQKYSPDAAAQPCPGEPRA
jgi:hypothetical protein